MASCAPTRNYVRFVFFEENTALRLISSDRNDTPTRACSYKASFKTLSEQLVIISLLRSHRCFLSAQAYVQFHLGTLPDREARSDVGGEVIYEKTEEEAHSTHAHTYMRRLFFNLQFSVAH